MKVDRISIEQVQTDRLYAPAGQRILNWFDVRKRKLGMVAFVLNRVTGIGLVVYLLIHIAVLSLLVQGESQWDNFINLVRSPFFLAMDVVLLAGILIHGLNGIRIGLVGLGISARNQKLIFVVLMIVSLLTLVYGAVKIFTIS